MSFFLSLGGSLSSRMMREEALGTTSTYFMTKPASHVTVAWRFTTVSLTVIFRPFQSMVAFWMSSPTFLGAYPINRQEENPHHTERTNLGGKSSGRSTFTTDSTEIN